MQNNPMIQLMQMLSMANNPQQIVQQMVANNPQARVAFNQLQQSGMNPQEYIMQYAKQNNIDVNQVVQGLRNMGAKF